MFEHNHVIKMSQDCAKLFTVTVKNCCVFITGFVVTCFVTVFERNRVAKTSHDFVASFLCIVTVVSLQAWLGTFLCAPQQKGVETNNLIKGQQCLQLAFMLDQHCTPKLKRQSTESMFGELTGWLWSMPKHVLGKIWLLDQGQNARLHCFAAEKWGVQKPWITTHLKRVCCLLPAPPVQQSARTQSGINQEWWLFLLSPANIRADLCSSWPAGCCRRHVTATSVSQQAKTNSWISQIVLAWPTVAQQQTPSKKRIVSKTHETVIIEPNETAINPAQCDVIFMLGLNFPWSGANVTSSTMQPLSDAWVSTEQSPKVCQALRECLIHLLFHPNWMLCSRGKKQSHWIA